MTPLSRHPRLSPSPWSACVRAYIKSIIYLAIMQLKSIGPLATSLARAPLVASKVITGNTSSVSFTVCQISCSWCAVPGCWRYPVIKLLSPFRLPLPPAGTHRRQLPRWTKQRTSMTPNSKCVGQSNKLVLTLCQSGYSHTGYSGVMGSGA